MLKPTLKKLILMGNHIYFSALTDKSLAHLVPVLIFFKFLDNHMTIILCIWLFWTCGPSIYDVHTKGVRLRWTGVSSMWTFAQKIRAH